MIIIIGSIVKELALNNVQTKRFPSHQNNLAPHEGASDDIIMTAIMIK